MRHEIILNGAGGQGLILAGAILAEIAGIFEEKEVANAIVWDSGAWRSQPVNGHYQR